MSIYSLTCPEVGCYTNFQCDPEFLNKVVAVAYVKKTAGFSILNQSATQLKTTFLQMMADGQAYIVFNTSGEKPRPDTATTAGRGMQTTKALAKTHTLNYQDMQGVVKENVEWYNNILSASQGYDFYYFTPGRVWDAAGNYVTIIGDPVVGADLNTYQIAEVSVTWVSKSNPLPFSMETDTFLEGLYLVISANSTWANFDWSTNDCSSFTPTLSAEPNQDGITISDVIWSLADVIETETPGVYTPSNFTGQYPPTIQIDSNSGNCTITPQEGGNGYGTFTAVAQTLNGCVIGQQEIKLTISGC